MAKVIAAVGGKGGTGKSTCSIQLSIALTKQGFRVLLIDMDEGMRCLDMLLGVSENLLFDLSDAVSGRPLGSCAMPIAKYSGLDLLAAPPQKGLVDRAAFSAFLSELDPTLYDFVVADLPAGTDKELYKSFPTDTDFLCVCNPNPVSVRDAQAVGRLLQDIGRRGSLIINKFERFYIKNPVFDNIDDIINQSGMTLMGLVPHSEALSLAFLNGKFPTRGKVAKAFRRIAKRLCGKNVPLPKLKNI